MKKFFGIALAGIAAFTMLTGCQQNVPVRTSTTEVGCANITSTYKPVVYRGTERIRTNDSSYLTINICPEDELNGATSAEDAYLLYTLTSYDVNGVEQQYFEDMKLYPQSAGKTNPTCKVTPGGYVVVELKTSKNETRTQNMQFNWTT